MAVKFIQYYDILSGRYAGYRNFISKSYIPGVNETDVLKIVGSWYLACGELTSRLLPVVYGYGSKILVPTGLKT